MTATTPRYVIPYPQGTDRVMDGDNAMQAIAERVEAVLAPIDDRSLTAPSGFRNVIRNGDMGIAQRGNGPFTALGYTRTLDGWAANQGGGALSLTRSGLAPGHAASVNGAAWALVYAVSGQAAVGDYARLVHSVEGVQTLAGRQVTLSFIANASAGTPKVAVSSNQQFGTGGSPSATVETSVGTITLSTTPTRYSLTFTIPSISGKTLGSNGDDNLGLMLWLSAGSTYAAGSANIGIQNATFTFTDVQLEAGATATPFERLPQSAQLLWCQRYFQRRQSNSSFDPVASGMWTGTNVFLVVLPFPVTMRAAPTVSNTSGFAAYGGSGGQTVTSIAWASTDPLAAAGNCTTGGGGAIGQGGVLYGAGPTALIDASAEL